VHCKPSLETKFDLTGFSGVGYEMFLNQFDSQVKHTYLLNKPAYWHKIIIKMSGNEDRVTLSVQSDNLYITGFANKHGEFTFL
jgi:hypothetical protein